MQRDFQPTSLNVYCTEVLDEFSELITEKSIGIISDFGTKNFHSKKKESSFLSFQKSILFIFASKTTWTAARKEMLTKQ